ncbi:MAG: transposase family protein, partial [Chloroflexi bacterium]|nr:transposase family protein [Chloroflexota bacterium]
MNRESIREYAGRQRERYAKANKKEKSKILDEVVAVTGYHRKAAVRLLSGKKRTSGGESPGRPVVYGHKVAAAARLVYEAAGGIGAKRLRPFIPELAARLEAFGELNISSEAGLLLRRASPATLERLLASDRVVMRRRVRSLTKPGTLLRQRIPVRTFSDWDDVTPGFLEVDTVAHCGDSTEGFHLWTVNAVDIATGWIEMDVVWGKTQVRVGAAIQKIRRRLPVPLLGLDSDNGSEFINHGLYEYCQTNKITFTRSRAYKKNDSAHVEQKNGAVVRRLVGYGRYMTAEAFLQMQRVYSLARLHANFFQPVRKLSAKSREGAKSIRFYDEAMTPYQRMVKSGKLAGASQAVLEKLYLSLN